jgi:hypothetical protein
VKSKRYCYGLTIVIGLGITRLVAAAPMFSVSGAVGLNFANPSISNSVSTSSPTTNATFGGGALADVNFYGDFQAEIGLFYLPYSYSISVTGGSTSTQTTYKFIHLPFLVRWSPIPILSVGAGGYFGFGTGTIDSQVNLGNGTSTSTSSVTYQQQNFNTTDFGLIFSAAGDLPLGPIVSLFVDARYQLGLTDLNNDVNATFKMSAFMILAGVRANF